MSGHTAKKFQRKDGEPEIFYLSRVSGCGRCDSHRRENCRPEEISVSLMVIRSSGSGYQDMSALV